VKIFSLKKWVFLQGPTAEDVKVAVKKVQDIIDMQVHNPDSEQAVALRAKHMHELAVLNGTLKDVVEKCLNCGRLGHKSWQCDESPNLTSAVICNACGGVGHLSKYIFNCLYFINITIN
jgi:splicing factor 1